MESTFDSMIRNRDKEL